MDLTLAYRVFIGAAVVSLIFALARVAGVQAQWFQAAAHLWVGWLIGLWMGRNERGWALLALALLLVELIAFALRHDWHRLLRNFIVE